jgi:hypothetical protein
LGQPNQKGVIEELKVPVDGMHLEKYSFIRELKEISLDEISSVKLMNRKDTKYLLPVSKLPDIIQKIKDQYLILEIDGKRMAAYETVYYDSASLDFFLSHVNGKLNRCKVRRRTYLDSGLHFFEVKRKTNKDKTIKTRIILTDHPDLPGEEAIELVKKQTGYDLHLLSPWLINRFSRITLVNTGMTERVTIDLNIRFMSDKEKEGVSQNDLVIIEIKQDKSLYSPIREVLSDMRIKKTGFSKYCLGIALTGQARKVNQLKRKIRKIQKITNHEYVT